MRLLITDVDNTLFDWVATWFAAYDALIVELEAVTAVPRAELERHLKAVHERHGTSEYVDPLCELPVSASMPAPECRRVVDAHTRARDAALTPYPHVVEVLTTLRARGWTLVAYTESHAAYAAYRVRRLGLDGLLHCLYAPRGQTPSSAGWSSRALLRSEDSQLQATRHREVPVVDLKPSPRVLDAVLADLAIPPHDAVYVGDNLYKDVAMAQRAGVCDVWAKYGTLRRPEHVRLLHRLCHWTEDATAVERVEAATVTPTYVLARGFDELMMVA
jgi:phosphoglycolate phosphatase